VGGNCGPTRLKLPRSDDYENVSPRPHITPEPRLGLIELYDEALPRVYGYLLSRTGDRVLAEDLAADSFLAAAEAVCRGTAPTPSTQWLIGVARHKLADHWRRQERAERGMRLLQGAGEEPADPWDERLDALRARAVLASLGPQHRAALTLRYVDGLPVREVAEYLGRTAYATEALLARARAAFRAAYRRGEGDQHD
jgi:RNA polymerase sigma-70 factor (ECF subfamily)